MNKNKSSMGMLLEFVLLVAVIAIVSVLVFQVNDDTRSSLVTNTAGCNATTKAGCGAGYNATLDADAAVGQIPANLDTLATAVVFGAIIYVITKVLPIARGASSSF